MSLFSTKNKLSHSKIAAFAKAFDAWMDGNRHSNQSHIDLLFKWLDSHEHTKLVKRHRDFLALAQEVAALGYSTAMDVPISEEDFANRKIADSFERWLAKNNQPLMTSADYLLSWIKEGDGAEYIRDRQHFLQLVQTLARRGYKHSLDLPTAAADFEKIYNSRTPFFVIAKQLLINHIKQYTKKHQAANVSMSNTFFLTPDHKLSSTKLELAVDLIRELRHLTSMGDDKVHLKILQNLLTKYEAMSQAYNGDVNRHRGIFEQNMDAARSLIEKFYDKLQSAQLQLLNVPCNSDPLNQLRYQTAQYFAKKLEVAPKQDFLIRQLSSKDLSAEKEKYVIQALQECEEAVRASARGGNDPEYLVKEKITRLQQLILRKDQAALSELPLINCLLPKYGMSF